MRSLSRLSTPQTKEIIMKRHATWIVILSLLISLPAAASQRDHERERRGNRDRWAKVLRSSPVHEQIRVVTPVRECWTERVSYERSHRGHRRHHSRTPALVGATIGGLLGREIAHDRRGRRIATLIGALVGGSVGHDVGHDIGHRRSVRHRRHRNAVDYRNEERCETRERVSWEQQVVGYDVKYKYRGRIYHTRLGHDPGRRMKVAVDVRPAHQAE
jgi:uncharacterized protein YcfJ